ncbi:hypothetical protein [Dokdonella immobilis]|uniref:HEPN domain-containing protein n=1 Tax=Dokdonella immobilis TaxID=578942 RepID=A0A1I4XZA0_9GAMM|nr:hypothetical protein [Dokdonella immobilis]SFN31122.1 hypothetical protein SAMN05216289_11362 [Dokdonella immobilis]
MNRRLFRPGGELDVRSRGNNRYEMNISLPNDADGRRSRECPDKRCSPGYFKVTPGTGITENHTQAFCPYCRHTDEPGEFRTEEQMRYAKDLVMREAHKSVRGLIKDAFGLGSSGRRKLGGGLISIEMSLKESPLPHVRRPFEEEVRRDVVCPRCTLDQTVFGLAVWCADCGADIFMSHVDAEIAVTRKMLGDFDRRRELLGKRVAAKDLENCLEDCVSLFEAAMRALARRGLKRDDCSEEDIEKKMQTLGNAFQSIDRTRLKLAELFALSIPEGGPWVALAAVFEKRHPITHNLGVVDRKYLKRAKAAEQQGREIRVTAAEVEQTLTAIRKAIAFVHIALFSSPEEAEEDSPEKDLNSDE